MWIERQIQNAIANVHRRMKFALECRHTMVTDILKEEIDGAYGQQQDEGFDYEQACGCGNGSGERPFRFPVDYTFYWSFDNEWEGDLEALTSLIHQYIVAYVLWHWFLIVGLSRAGTLLRSTLADEFRAEAEQALEDAVSEGRNEQGRNMIFIL